MGGGLWEVRRAEGHHTRFFVPLTFGKGTEPKGISF